MLKYCLWLDFKSSVIGMHDWNHLLLECKVHVRSYVKNYLPSECAIEIICFWNDRFNVKILCVTGLKIICHRNARSKSSAFGMIGLDSIIIYHRNARSKSSDIRIYVECKHMVRNRIQNNVPSECIIEIIYYWKIWNNAIIS